jgi:hypothetical protein
LTTKLYLLISWSCSFSMTSLPTARRMQFSCLLFPTSCALGAVISLFFTSLPVII